MAVSLPLGLRDDRDVGRGPGEAGAAVPVAAVPVPPLPCAAVPGRRCPAAVGAPAMSTLTETLLPAVTSDAEAGACVVVVGVGAES